MPPDPENPQPLLPAEDLLALLPTIQLPIDIHRDLSLAIGAMGPPNGSVSSRSDSGFIDSPVWVRDCDEISDALRCSHPGPLARRARRELS
jgi:hypothetical protein